MLGLSDELYEKFADLIRKKFGISYLSDQKNTLNNRLMPLLISYKIRDFNEFYSFLETTKDEKFLTDFIGRVTTNHTYFYREHIHFDFLNTRILPELAKKINEEDDLKIWVAACSTGEEAYTLAMVIHSYFFSRGLKIHFSILATDISRNAVQTAELGIYKNSSLEKLPPNLANAYMKKKDEHHKEVISSIRKLVLFRVLNLVRDDFPFKGKFHIVFLRNVLIYFEENSKQKLIRQINSLLFEGGYLFIGQTESFSIEEKSLQTFYPSIFRKSESDE